MQQNPNAYYWLGAKHHHMLNTIYQSHPHISRVERDRLRSMLNHLELARDVEEARSIVLDTFIDFILEIKLAKGITSPFNEYSLRTFGNLAWE